jgi:hypothetical protein
MLAVTVCDGILPIESKCHLHSKRLKYTTVYYRLKIKWFNIKLSPKKWFNIKLDSKNGLTIELDSKNGLTIELLSQKILLVLTLWRTRPAPTYAGN